MPRRNAFRIASKVRVSKLQALYVSPLISEAIKKWGATSFSLPELVALFPPIGFLLLAFVAIEAYSRGVDVVFRGIELGANERLADLDRTLGS